MECNFIKKINRGNNMNINTFAKQFQILINIFFGRVMKSRKEINLFWFCTGN